jgi:DNA-binding FadR family transcriptional regulator
MTPKIERKSLSAIVAQHLQERIESGAYPIGGQLPSEHEMTREFEVGRSSIREAIRKLENNGLVRVQQGLGTFVLADKPNQSPLSQLLQNGDEAEIREVRELLEIKIAERAALHRTQEDVRALNASWQRRNIAAEAGQPIPWIEADIAFHTTIADASGNKVLANLYRVFALQDLRKSIEKSHSKTQSLQKLKTLHAQLLESIISREPGKAVEVTWKINRLIA